MRFQPEMVWIELVVAWPVIWCSRDSFIFMSNPWERLSCVRVASLGEAGSKILAVPLLSTYWMRVMLFSMLSKIPGRVVSTVMGIEMMFQPFERLRVMVCSIMPSAALILILG